jgi:hypothetical protein
MEDEVVLLKVAENWDGRPATRTAWVFIQTIGAQQVSIIRHGGLQGFHFPVMEDLESVMVRINPTGKLS